MLLAHIIHEGSSSPTHPSPIIWRRVREGVRDRRVELRGLAPTFATVPVPLLIRRGQAPT